MSNSPKDGAPGTTEQSPRWEGPEETRPRGYLPAKDDPKIDRDAAGENLNDPDRNGLSAAESEAGGAQQTDSSNDKHDRIQRRAYELWERDSRQHGSHDNHWHQAVSEVEREDVAAPQATAAGMQQPPKTAKSRRSKG